MLRREMSDTETRKRWTSQNSIESEGVRHAHSLSRASGSQVRTAIENKSEAHPLSVKDIGMDKLGLQ